MSRRTVVAAVFLFPLAGGCNQILGIEPPVLRTVLRCQVQRQECIGEVRRQGDIACRQFSAQPVNFFATICSNESEDPDAACQAAFCDYTKANPVPTYPYPDGCTATRAPTQPDPAVVSTSLACRQAPAGQSTGNTTLVDFERHSRICREAPGDISVCASLPVDQDDGPTTNADRCFDLTQFAKGASDAAASPADNRDRSVNLIRIVENAAECVTSSSMLVFNLPPGTMGTISGGGFSVPMSIVRGFAEVRQNCLEGCFPTSLNRLRVDLGAVSVAGVELTNVTLGNVTAATISQGQGQTFAADELRFVLTGRVNGALFSYVGRNRTPWTAAISPAGFAISGTLDLVEGGPAGSRLPISVTVNVSGVPGTSDTIACANQSPRQRLFGFEDAQSWSSTSASLSLVTTPLTQGCAALGVSGSGFMSIAGAPFSARGLPAASSMTTDLFIPGNQPNPFWLGALQAHVSCPTANAFDVYIGQVELTGKPVGRFSTLTFLVPTAVRNLLQNPSNSCSFRFGLNVNPTGRKWVLDNLTLRP